MNLFEISNLLCGTSCLLLALFCALAGKDRPYRLLMWFNLACSVWGFGCFITGVSDSPTVGVFGWKLAHLGGFFVAPIYWQFVHSVLRKTPNIYLLIFGYAQAVVLNVFNFFTPWVMDKSRVAFGIFFAEATPLLFTAVLIYLFFVLLSYLLLATNLKAAEGPRRTQIQYIFGGFLFGYVGGTSTFVPEFHIDWIYPAGNLGVFIYAAIITYAILREKILDVEELVATARKDKLAAIGTLAASINHEIRNPLYIIQGLADSYLTNVKEGIYANERQALQKSNEILEKTAEQSTRAMEIMKRFAVFAKQGIKDEAELGKVDLNDTLNGILPLIGHELELDKIKLEKNLPEDLSPIQADRRHVEEILFNLIVNACQAMKERDKLQETRDTCLPSPVTCQNTPSRIEISASQQNGTVRVCVEDNGPGIPANRLKQIFEPFYTTKEAGTGLGLYITRQLVERNQGRIAVKSKPGCGTKFILEFKS